MTGKATPISTVISEAAPKFFNFNFPFYDESKRTEFEEQFIRHFYMREIGMETQAYFFLRLEDKLDTIMPYFNKLLLAAAKEYDPFYTEIIDETITREHESSNTGKDTTETSNTNTVNGSSTTNTESSNSSETNGTNSNTTESSADDNNQQSDLPQGALANFNDNSYMTSAGKGHTESNSTVSGTDKTTATGSGTGKTTVTDETKNVGSGNVTVNRSGSDSGNSTETRKANNIRGNQSEMLRLYYEAQRNILNEIYNECEDLFINLWV